jgi:hypothetical protein
VFTRLDGTPVIQLPRSDAYKEIYTNPKWYGLVPDEKLLDPAGIVKARLSKDPTGGTVLENFYTTVGKVVKNQTKITGAYHSTTYVAYGNGALKPKPINAATEGNDQRKSSIERGKKLKDLLTWGKVVWRGIVPPDVTEEELLAARQLSDSHSGNLRVSLDVRKVTIEFTVQKTNRLPGGEDESDLSTRDSKNGIIVGDGTVPVWSAEAQARGLDPRVKGDAASGIQMAFVQSGYDHQFSYNHPWARWAALYSIVQIAQEAPEPSC